jgi:hypothetical protein
MGVSFKAGEAAVVATEILQSTAGHELDADLRQRLAKRLQAIELTTLRMFPASLESDLAHPAKYYLAADVLTGKSPAPVLLEFAPATLSSGGLFTKPVFTAQIRANASDVTVKAFPFAASDHENILAFAERVDRSFLPRPQRAEPAIAAGNRHPEISLPAVFDAYREILGKMRVNMASTVQLSATREMTTEEALSARDGEDPTAIGHTRVSIRHLYHAGLWAAIRSGWREGYTAEADHFIVSGNSREEIRRSVEAVKTAIRHAAGYTKFTTDTSRLFELQADPRHPEPWSDAKVRERFEQLFQGEEQKWIWSEFTRPFAAGEAEYRLSEPEILRLAVKFGQSLKLNEDLYDYISKVKAEAGSNGGFDFEPSIDEADTLTTAQEMIFYMHWLKARGRPAQLCPPNLGFKKRQAYPVAMETTVAQGVGLKDYCKGKMWPELMERVEKNFHAQPLQELAARISELAAVARSFDATLSIHSGSGKQPEVLELIGKATAGRVNYKISGELQLQLFDVLAGQPRESSWRRLFERMVRRTNDFAAAGAFGYESELAAKYRAMGREYELGDSTRGRVDGNLFLVFWLGNIIGSRDIHSPDGDRRFFKEKIDELPENLLSEVRRRNSRYVVWLAEHLQA